jgi:hypothetical protein
MLPEKTEGASKLIRGLRYHAAVGLVTDILNSCRDGASKTGAASREMVDHFGQDHLTGNNQNRACLSGELACLIVKPITGIQQRNPIAAIGKDGSYSWHFGVP